MSRLWHETYDVYIWLFNVGRGLSMFIRTPQNFGIGYDLGVDGRTGTEESFSPLDFISNNIAEKLDSYREINDAGVGKARQVAQWVISHPHADHIAEADKLREHLKIVAKKSVGPYFITCPNDAKFKTGAANVETVDFGRVITEENRKIVESYRSLYHERQPPLRTIIESRERQCYVPDFEYGLYYLRPSDVSLLHPTNNTEYINGLSVLLYLRFGSNSILITGDVTPPVMKAILEERRDVNVEKRYSCFGTFSTEIKLTEDANKATHGQPSLASLLKARGLTILVAPHHGLESGYSGELFTCIRQGKPQINIISERRSLGDMTGSVHPTYQSSDGALGLDVDIDGNTEKTKYSVSTKNGHHMLMIFASNAQLPRVILRKNPSDLLQF